MIIRYLIIKEFKQFFRNWLLPVACFLIPVLLMNMAPRIATQEVKGLNFAVVDNDHSTTSRRIIQKIDASTYLTLVNVSDTYEQAMKSIHSGEADLVLEFQPHFEKDMINTGTARILLSANATNGTKGAMAQAYITNIIQSYAKEVSESALSNVEGSSSSSFSSPKVPSVRFLFNNRLDYKIYMIPAIFALMLMLIVGFLPALNIVGEKESGTIEQINVTPVGRVEFIVSKVIPYICIGMIMVAEAILAARGLYGILPSGLSASNPLPILNIYIVSILFCAIASSMGLIVSNYSSTIRQAALTMLFFLVIFIVMSGLLTPITSMPEWAQSITRLNPMRYLSEALRAIYIKGANLSQISQQVLYLTLMSVITWTWAIVSYRKSN